MRALQHDIQQLLTTQGVIARREHPKLAKNLLVLDGWCVLRFTWAMIEEGPEEVIAMVRKAIEILAARRS